MEFAIKEQELKRHLVEGALQAVRAQQHPTRAIAVLVLESINGGVDEEGCSAVSHGVHAYASGAVELERRRVNHWRETGLVQARGLTRLCLCRTATHDALWIEGGEVWPRGEVRLVCDATRGPFRAFPHVRGCFRGAACRNRTDDLVITSDSLYRLS